MPPMSVTFATFQLKRSVLKVVQFQNISSKSVAFAAFHLERSASNLMITYVDAAPANAIAAVASAVVLSRSQQNFWQQQQLTADDDGGWDGRNNLERQGPAHLMGTAGGLDGQCLCARGTTITEWSDSIALVDSFLPGDAGIEEVDSADRQQ
jgi:hypothetical protein